MHTCSQFLQIIPPAYTPAIRRLWKNPPDHFWKIPAGQPLEKLAWPLLENITTNACKSYQESTFTKHFVCLAVLSARSLSRPNLNQSLQKAGITNCEYGFRTSNLFTVYHCLQKTNITNYWTWLGRGRHEFVLWHKFRSLNHLCQHHSWGCPPKVELSHTKFKSFCVSYN